VSHFLISCGGTGGHLSPGIALAENLTEQGHKAILLISKKKVDATLSQKYPQLQFKAIPGTGFTWKPLGLLKCIYTQSQAFFICLGLVKKFKPRAVIGFGGFTSAAIIIAARLHGIRVCLHESNHVPGLAMRTLGRLAQRIYLPPGVTLPHMRVSKLVSIGMPVRQEIKKIDKALCKQFFGLDPSKQVVGVLGGSQGALALNTWAHAQVEVLAKHGIQLLCVTGLGKGPDETFELVSDNGAKIKSRFIGFCSSMPEFLNACDLVISRAGAGSIAELTVCQTPSILIPYPQAADNHQAANAMYFEKKGGCAVIHQAQIAGLNWDYLKAFLEDSNLEKIRAQLKILGQDNPCEVMIHDLTRSVS
jgi:UDP-N-acetylglucosamine--N-acetylmuramyl-(pentapeptide) pyrophosphoryl-undecaprenol N-acetylglucosamine transferase